MSKPTIEPKVIAATLGGTEVLDPKQYKNNWKNDMSVFPATNIKERSNRGTGSRPAFLELDC